MISTQKQTETPTRLTMPLDLYLLDAPRRMDEDLNPSPESAKRQARRKDSREFIAAIRRNLKFGGAILAASAVAVVGAINTIKDANQNGRYNPNAVVHHYTVGTSPEDRMLSEVASDMHAVAPNQNYNEELPIIDTYVSAKEAHAGTAKGGRVIDFRVDTKAGKLLPKLPRNSACL